MNVLQVIHGYPMRYNAGSEVYTQTLSQGLARRHEVQVFTRQENPFGLDFEVTVERDPSDPRILLNVINLPRTRDRYRYQGVDAAFAEILDRWKPEIVHVGHLNHLSTSIVTEAAVREIPIVFTLHDYWLMCPRGQFMQTHPENREELWPACDGQVDRKCAERCYARYFSGAPEELEEDIRHWTGWVRRRMAHVREIVEQVDLFLAPARYLMRRFHEDFGLAPSKLRYLDYGFDLERLRGRMRAGNEPFTFGYIGTHIPAKGVHLLLKAFGQVRADSRLRIYGRPREQNTEGLKAIAAGLPENAADRVSWLPEYRNQDIVRDVFNQVDAIVIPSVWVENSPLVIHEAQHARVPVIAADIGGMAEYVRDGENGILFRHRDIGDLARAMEELVRDPDRARRMGDRGYLFNENGDIPDIGSHVEAVEKIYEEVLARRDSSRIHYSPGPWRITFDTNPDECNLACVMCEKGSPFKPKSEDRQASHNCPKRMPIELIRKTVMEAKGRGLREIIPSTMGEPLLYERFDEIIDLCAETGIKLNLTTNGTFPGRGARAWAKRIVPVASDVKISWNGATQETQERIMRGSKWEAHLENVRAFVSVRDEHHRSGGDWARLTFQMTFLEWNVDELPDLVRLAVSLGVDRLKGHHVWTHFPELEGLSMRRDPAAIERWNRAVDAAYRVVDEERLPGGRQLLLENIHPLTPEGRDNIAPGGPCPFLGREAWVNTEGRFDPCCAPDALRKSLGDFGNLHDMSFGEIWESDAYRLLVKTYRTRALCIGCNMRRPVEGA